MSWIPARSLAVSLAAVLCGGCEESPPPRDADQLIADACETSQACMPWFESQEECVADQKSTYEASSEIDPDCQRLWLDLLECFIPLTCAEVEEYHAGGNHKCSPQKNPLLALCGDAFPLTTGDWR